MKALFAAALLLACSTGCSRKTPPSEAPAVLSFQQFADDYFRSYFAFYPTEGASLGFHEYDDKIEDFSAVRYRTRSADLRRQLEALESIRQQKLSAEDALDAEVIDGKIRSELLDMDTIRWWRRNAIPYVSTPGQSIDQLMKRNFAPADKRLRSVISRLSGIEKLLASLRENVTEPPRELTELAHRICAGSVGFFRNDVAAWAKEAARDNASLLAEFESANQKVVAAFELTANYLSTDQLPLSTSPFAIGAEAFARKLRYEEMIDLPLDKLLAIGEAQLEKDRQAFVATAKLVRPGVGPAQAMQWLSNDHPSEGQLLEAARATVEGIRKFILDKKIIAIPSEVRPTILETPPFARAGAFASMDTPGPFETIATEAFYYLTPPEKKWTAQHKEEHLRLFNKPVMDIITIHEAYPGHYTQFLYAKQFPTRSRKLLFTRSNSEGWAHYAEQMMVEEGWGAGDPKIKLAQLSEALLRDCRFIAGIKLHTQNQTVEQASRLFIEKGFQEPANAHEEARRGAYDPTYLYYTAGKLQVYKLREDYKRARPSAYSLGKFHSDVILQGSIPIKLLRRILLPGDQAPSL